MSFEYGKGLKLNADTDSLLERWYYTNGYLGHYANSVHPLHKLPIQNARLEMSMKFSSRPNSKMFSVSIHSKMFVAGDIGYIPLVATKDIEAGEEIIINYGDSYWSTLDAWNRCPREKTESMIERDYRKLIRDCNKVVLEDNQSY